VSEISNLAARDLSYGYPARTIGRDVTIELNAGEALALLGPNGGGKTTLLKTMLGLLSPQAGSVLLDQRPLASISLAERARLIAYVPQSHAGTFAFTAFEIVLMGRTAHMGLFGAPSVKDRAVAQTMLERLGIAHLAAQPYTMISGGERQLVLVARALAQEPRFIILDEPTASLDFGNQGKVMQQIKRLTSEGLGVLFTSHDPNQVLRYADRVALLGEGRILSAGLTQDILTQSALATLYNAGVEVLTTPDGRTVFLPG
jgi:iron complex transport system ATP-binding protein